MCAWGPPRDDGDGTDVRSDAASVASGRSPNSPGSEVFGRSEETGRINRLLDDALGERSGCVLLVGEAGIGKTTLLEVAAAREREFTVLATRGVESEAVLPHAALLGLLSPVLDLVEELPDAQAEALNGAFGRGGSAASADRFLVGAATLSLLAAAAASGPVLVLVDDLHWLDRESAAAITFAARRMGPDAVAFVLATRPGGAATELVRDLPTIELRGLDAASAAELVGGRLVPAAASRLAEGTLGNPLAMLEVAERLTDAQRAGAAPLPDPLPVADRLRVVYESTLVELSADAWSSVVLAALDEGRAAGGIADPAALDEALGRGILVTDRAGLRFRHPLVRSAVLHLATPAQQRAAHRALADALPAGDPARTWHLVEANLGTDDALADDLARLAVDDRVRLGFAAASAAWEQSAALTVDPGRAAERLADAAEDAFVAGDLSRARDLADRVLTTSVVARPRGRALFTLGVMEQYAGSVPRAVDHLAASCGVLDGADLVRSLTELALARFRLNDLGGIAECAERINAAADLSDPAQRLPAVFTGAVAHALDGDFEAALPLFAQVPDLALSEDLRHDPRALFLLALAAGFAGDVREAVTRGAPRVDEVRRRGAVGVLVPLLALTAAGRAWAGDHAGAFADAGEAVELAGLLGYAADAAVAEEMLSWQLAGRGRHEEAAESLARARLLLDRAGTTSVAAHHALTEAYCALCRGDLARVVDLLGPRVEADGGVGEMGEPLAVAPLLVEAYAGLGRDAEGLRLTQEYAEVTPSSAPAATRALVQRCVGLCAPTPAAAREAFEAALTLHGAADPFEAARTRLLYGSRLRRDRERVSARTQLGLAHEAFSRFELTHWAERAAGELGATGASARPRGVGTDEQLTSQETRVALLVAEGRSNKEVAAALFISPKTVERHLGNVFRKRGFTSRAELAGAYARLAPGS